MSVDDERESELFGVEDAVDSGEEPSTEECLHPSKDDTTASDERDSSSLGVPDEDTGMVPQAYRDGVYNAETVNDQVFEELRLGPDAARDVQTAWAAFLRSAESPEVAAEALYAAMFDVAPTLQALFKTPRAILSMRFLHGVGSVVGSLQEPAKLKTTAEALGFQHLDYEVTAARVVLFRDAIVDVVATEIGPQFTDAARQGLKTALNYVGGALIYVRENYAARLRILASSWAVANKRPAQLNKADGATEQVGAPAQDSGGAVKAWLCLGASAPVWKSIEGSLGCGAAVRIARRTRISTSCYPSGFEEACLFGRSRAGVVPGCF